MILPQVHLVKGVRGAQAYLLLDQELTLIDTGLPGNGKRILAYITSLGFRPEALTRILLTHKHIDHCGSAQELKALTGAQVLAHRDDTEDWKGQAIVAPRPGRPRHLLRSFLRFLPVIVDGFLEGHELLPCLGGLKVLHVPGHTPGSLCFYSAAQKVLFCGDLILNRRGHLSRPIVYSGAAPEKFEDALAGVAALDFEVCCFAHGEPWLQGAAQAVRELAGHRPTAPTWWRVLRGMGRLVVDHLSKED